MRVSAAIVFAMFVILSCVPALHAQENRPLPKRTVLMTNDLGTFPGHQGVVSEVELAPGVKEAKHTHPGELLGYVQQGALTLYVEGKPTTTVKAGQAFFVPANTVHWGENEGKTACKVTSTLVVPKGQPLTSPAK
jgi:quercetin dioxygenase-like cupin family protein